ncbi:MAG: HAD-IIIA family hydrolase [Candidatus Zophobacter franzmannii]|nr:HAD-IIIA family hydrolase [Candidatus Zophobacter franzmannii]
MDIKLLAMDVDGVLTDGSIITHADGSESKRFHACDGGWIRIWQRQGLKTAVITGRQCPAVAHRMEDLKIDFVYQKAIDKIPVFEQLLEDSQIPPEQIAYIGDDVFDLPVMRRVGFSAVVPQVITELRAAADYMTTRSSGCGAVGELIQHLLKKMDLWDNAMERYRR